MKNIKPFGKLNEEKEKPRLRVSLKDRTDYNCVNRIFQINDVQCRMTLSAKDATIVFDSQKDLDKGLDFLDKVNIKWQRLFGVVAK